MGIMNLKIRDGYVWINGQMAYPITPHLFSGGGANIPESNYGSAADIPEKKQETTVSMGDANRVVCTLLESLAKRLETMAPIGLAWMSYNQLAEAIRDEKEKWK
jgi:hypothetical protein